MASVDERRRRAVALFLSPFELLTDRATLIRGLRRLNKSFEKSEVELREQIAQKTGTVLASHWEVARRSLDEVHAEVSALMSWRLPPEQPALDDVRLAASEFAVTLSISAEEARDSHVSTVATSANVIAAKSDARAVEISRMRSEIAAAAASVSEAAAASDRRLAAVRGEAKASAARLSEACASVQARVEALLSVASAGRAWRLELEAAQAQRHVVRRRELEQLRRSVEALLEVPPPTTPDDDDRQRSAPRVASAAARAEDGGAEDGGAEDGGAEDGGAEDGGAEDGGAEDGGAEAGTLAAGPVGRRSARLCDSVDELREAASATRVHAASARASAASKLVREHHCAVLAVALRRASEAAAVRSALPERLDDWEARIEVLRMQSGALHARLHELQITAAVQGGPSVPRALRLSSLGSPISMV